MESVVGDMGGGAEEPDIARLVLDAPDLALVVDLIDATSDLSALPEFGPSLPGSTDVDALGLSVLALPGIFDLMAPLREREDSFVSDLLNEGYDCNPSPADRSPEDEDVFPDAPSLFFDCCWPMALE